MSKPAGVELRRWFTYMVLLLIFVNIATVIGSVIIFKSVDSIVSTYQPFSVHTSEIEQHVILAQRGMYEYLSEMSDSTKATLANVDDLKASIKRAEKFAPGPSQKESLKALDTLSSQYRMAIEQLPNAMEGSRDWSRVEEIRTTSVSYGEEAAKLASDLATEARKEINNRNATAQRVTTITLVVFIIVFFASFLVLLTLRHWWRTFQDTMMGL
jgi:hypothetical protein